MSVCALDCITHKKVTAETYEGRKIYCPDCPKDNNKVKYVPASDKHIAYLAHVKLHANNPCKRFNINISETDEHLYAKNDIIRLLTNNKKKFIFKRKCNLYPYQKCKKYKLIELDSLSIEDEPISEHRFNDIRQFRSDISILKNGKLFFIIEIHHTNPTKVENRPDDINWVEITTQDVFNINDNDDVINLNCERDYACEDCLNKQEIEKQKELEKRLKMQEERRLNHEKELKKQEEQRLEYEEIFKKIEQKKLLDSIEKERIEKEKRLLDEIEKEKQQKIKLYNEEQKENEIRIKELQQEEERKKRLLDEIEKKEKNRIWRENYEKTRIINERNNAIEKVLIIKINKFKKDERERKKQIKYQKGLDNGEYKEIILNDKLYVLTREDDLIFTCDGDFVGYYINGELDIPVYNYD